MLNKKASLNESAIKSPLISLIRKSVKQGLDFIFFAIVDTKTENAHFVVYSDAEAELAAKAYGETTQDHLMYLPSLMSRKSQLMPAVQATLSA